MSGESETRPSDARAGLFVVLAALVVHASTLRAGYTIDDVPCIVQNERLESLANVGLYFREHFLAHDPTTQHPNLYRPLSLVAFALERALFGLDARASHAINLVLHALASFLAWRFARALLAPFAALAAGLLFAVHPIHTEAIANVLGRSELMAFVGVLGAACAIERARTFDRNGRGRASIAFGAAAALAFAFGVFSKESAIVWPGLWIALEALRPDARWLLARRPRALAAFALACVVAVVFLALRASAVAEPLQAAGMAGSPADARIGTALVVLWDYVVLCVAPVTLLAAYTSDEVAIESSLLSLAPLLSLGALLACGLALWVVRARLRNGLTGFAWFVVALAPASNLAFAIGTMKAERLLYLPSLGICIVLGALAGLLRARAHPSIAALALGVVASAYAARSWLRNADWRDNATIARATLEHSPRSPLAHGILADEAWRAGDAAAAREHAQAYLAVSPSPNGWALLGEIERSQGRVDAAARAFETAWSLDRRRVDVVAALTQLNLAHQRFAEALPWLERLAQMRPNDPAAAANRFVAYSQLGKHDRAATLARDAARRFAADPTVLELAGQCLRAAGDGSAADELQRRAASLRAVPR